MGTQDPNNVTLNIVKNSARNADIADDKAEELAIHVLLNTNRGEWGQLVWWAPGDKLVPSYTRAMPRHTTDRNIWRFTNDGGWEMFIHVNQVFGFDKEGA